MLARLPAASRHHPQPLDCQTPTPRPQTPTPLARLHICRSVRQPDRHLSTHLPSPVHPPIPPPATRCVCRYRSLLATLSSRAARPQYATAARPGPAGGGFRAVIIGAGPVGLRCAIELAMLGVGVQVLESRDRFSRLQVLHLWDWVEADLIELGIKGLDPSIFTGSDFRHVSTSQLQHSLLKVALLLGVTVRFGCSVADMRSLSTHLTAAPSGNTSALVATADRPPSVPPPASEPPPRAPLGRLTPVAGNAQGSRASPNGKRSKAKPSRAHTGSTAATAATAAALPDVLIDATGARCALFETLGLTQSTTRFARATCLVVHLRNHKTAEENNLQESTWSQQYHQAAFAALARDHGVVLQNIVYYRSTGAFSDAATHYFVMTTELEALVAAGALRSAAVEGPLTAASNVVTSRLEAYARAAIGAFVPTLAAQEMVPGQLSIFDFSERKQSSRAALLVDASLISGKPALAPAEGAAGCVLVTRVGDALQEPFWPEGLGINRGFLHVLDCADLVQGYAALRRRGAATDDEYAQLLERREALFAYTKRVSGANRLTELKPHCEPASKAKLAYTVDPHTRYASLPASLPPLPLPPTGEEENFFRI